jgi:hypothetical protein
LEAESESDEEEEEGEGDEEMDGVDDGQAAAAPDGEAVNGDKQAGTHQTANHSQDVMVH